MKLSNIVIFAAVAAAAAIPMPLNEADVEILRARGFSEADIAHALHPSPANPVASLLRRNIDADGEVQPSHYLSPHPHRTRRWDTAGDMSAVEHDGSLTPAHREHNMAIVRFMDNLMSGRLSGIAAGTGGSALRRRDAEADAEKRSFVGNGTRANKFWSFGAMNRGMPRLWKGRKGHGASSAHANANANANAKALSSSTTTSSSSANANANAPAKANHAIKGARAPEQEELTRPERWVYRW